MGDFISPKRRDVFHRLRRRIESYRQRQGDCLGHYQPHLTGLYEHQIQETSQLHQKWLDSKVKRHSSRKSTSKEDNFDDRSLASGARHKRKHEYVKGDIGCSNKDSGELQGKISPDSRNSSESRINGHITGKSQDGQSKLACVEQCKLSTDMNNSVTQTRTSSGQLDSKNNINIHACLNNDNHLIEKPKAFCKEEPMDVNESQCHSSHSSHHSFPDIDDVDELQAILESLTEDGDDLSGEIIKEIGLTLKEDVHVGPCSVDIKNKSKMAKNPSFDKKTQDNQCSRFQDPLFNAHSSDKFCESRLPTLGFGTSQTVCSHHVETSDNLGPPRHLLGDTGPAAETLKQMAAQHQNQEGAQFGKNRQSPFNPKCFSGSIGRDESQQQYHYSGSSNFGSGHITAQSYPEESKLSLSPTCVSQSLNDKQIGISLNYGGTKPLTHYGGSLVSPASMATEQPSSLQQLQNQVHSHFNQAQANRPTSTPYINHAFSTANTEIHANLNMQGPVHNTPRYDREHPIQIGSEKKPDIYSTRLLNNSNMAPVVHHLSSKNCNMQGIAGGIYGADKKPTIPLPTIEGNKRTVLESNYVQPPNYLNSDHKSFHGLSHTECPTSLAYMNSVNEHTACPPNVGYGQKSNVSVVSRQFSDNWSAKSADNENMHPLVPMRSNEYGYSGLPVASAENCDVQNTFPDNRSSTAHERPCSGIHDAHAVYDNRSCYTGPVSNQGDSTDRKIVDLGSANPHVTQKSKVKGQMVATHINSNQFHNMPPNQQHMMGHVLYPMEHSQNYSSQLTQNFM